MAILSAGFRRVVSIIGVWLCRWYECACALKIPEMERAWRMAQANELGGDLINVHRKIKIR